MRKLGIVFAVMLAASIAAAEEKKSCDAKQSTGTCDEIILGGAYSDVYVTVQCPTASTSEVVIWTKYCSSCSAVRFPKVGDPPITNIGSVPNKPSRTFQWTTKPYSIQPEILNWQAGAITAIVSYE